MSSDKDKSSVDIALLEEDDEFEEFPSDEWDENCEDDDDINVWEDKWDDDNVHVGYFNFRIGHDILSYINPYQN